MAIDCPVFGVAVLTQPFDIKRTEVILVVPLKNGSEQATSLAALRLSDRSAPHGIIQFLACTIANKHVFPLRIGSHVFDFLGSKLSGSMRTAKQLARVLRISPASLPRLLRMASSTVPTATGPNVKVGSSHFVATYTVCFGLFPHAANLAHGALLRHGPPMRQSPSSEAAALFASGGFEAVWQAVEAL